MWRKIDDSTPRDGTKIDFWVRCDGANGVTFYRVADAYWNKDEGEWWAPDRDWEGAHGPLFTIETPTHWMLQPAPPTTEGE